MHLVYLYSEFLDPKCMTLHLSALNCSCHAVVQSSSASISSCSNCASGGLFTSRYTFVSSANIWSDFTTSGISFTNRMNRSGPN